MIGHSIFLDLTSEFQRQKKSNRDNFDQFLTNPDDLGCPQNYLAMGLAAIHFPQDKVTAACSARLARQIVQRWTEPLQRVANVGAFTEGEIGRLGLDPEEIKRQVTVANSESGELLRDNAMAYWNNANRQYETAYPGHNRVVEFLSAKQIEQSTRFVDNDPNPDLLGKRRQNLGEFPFQMQENLRALIPAKEVALRGFISECVNDPNRRHGVARAFLDQASERFRAYADGMLKQRDADKETLVPASEQRDSQLGDINRYAGEWALALIPTAKKREIDERKDNYLRFARQWDVTVIDIRAADTAIYFYTAMLGVLDKLKDEMDAYIERMRSLEAFFRHEEQTAIENPVDVNGVVLFDRGRRVEMENGLATYVDGDIDRRYAAYVGDGTDPGNPTVSTAAADALAELGSAGNIYGLRDGDLGRVKTTLRGRALQVFAAVANESVLDKFFEKFGVGTDRSVAELRRVYALSQPFIHLQENAPNYKHHQNKEQTIAGMLHGAEGRTDAEQQFLVMLRDTIQGIRDGQITNSNESHQVLFLRERAAFPLRLLEGMESYRFAYEQTRAQGASANPIHTRRDVREWIRINPPSFEDQKAAWKTFCAAWASGVITEEHDIRYTATGQRDSVRFSASYRDRFGIPKIDPLGAFVPITGDMAKLIAASESPQEMASRPPKEAREIILLLCDQPTLKEHLDAGLETKLREFGVAGLGDLLVAHAQAQQRTQPEALYRPYQQAIAEYLEQINYGGPAAAAAAPTQAIVTPIPPPALPAPAAIPTEGVLAEKEATIVTPAASNGSSAGAVNPTGVGNVAALRERLSNLKALYEEGLITEQDYNTRRASILAEV